MAPADFKPFSQENSRPVPTTKETYRRPELLQYGSKLLEIGVGQPRDWIAHRQKTAVVQLPFHGEVLVADSILSRTHRLSQCGENG